jgi:hypothetical protein
MAHAHKGLSRSFLLIAGIILNARERLGIEHRAHPGILFGGGRRIGLGNITLFFGTRFGLARARTFRTGAVLFTGRKSVLLFHLVPFFGQMYHCRQTKRKSRAEGIGVND